VASSLRAVFPAFKGDFDAKGRKSSCYKHFDDLGVRNEPKRRFVVWRLAFNRSPTHVDDSAVANDVEFAVVEAFQADENAKAREASVGHCGALLTAEELAASCSSSASERVLATDLENCGGFDGC
jgi:hypothetical protein